MGRKAVVVLSLLQSAQEYPELLSAPLRKETAQLPSELMLPFCTLLAGWSRTCCLLPEMMNLEENYRI